MPIAFPLSSRLIKGGLVTPDADTSMVVIALRRALTRTRLSAPCRRGGGRVHAPRASAPLEPGRPVATARHIGTEPRP